MNRSLVFDRLRQYASVFGTVSLAAFPTTTLALDGGTLRVNPDNGWKAFEVISQNNNPSGDGYSYSMPGTFDGAGAYMIDSNTLRVHVNHETSDASISDVDIDLAGLQTAISNMINNGNTGGVSFVNSARQAYDRWSSNGGSSWTNTSSASNTSFSRFCSSQAYAPNTFGNNRGFVDQVYITGEEVSSGRLFALDSIGRDFYQLSGVTGSAPGGIGGMSYDSWENAALIDTGETDYVALLLSPDGGSSALKLYIGEKGKDASGQNSGSFLARNGLAYGSWYYLNSSLPGNVGNSNNGSFDTSSSGALAASKMEDVDTSPSNPTQVVLGNQNYGVFTLDFNLVFSGSGFDAGGSSFSVTKISSSSGGSNSVNGPDNVDWTAATTLGSNAYPNGLIFVNEDNSSGEIWQMNPNGSNKVRVGQTTVGAESTGIFDLSEFVGYPPGAVLISNNQGSPSSMTVLINPEISSSGGGGNSQTLTASQDTFVSSSQSNANFNGSNDELLADGSDGTYGEMMSLIKFDMTQVPQCATVTGATLNINLFNPSPGTYGVYEATTTWSASSATWNSIGGSSVKGGELATFNPSSAGTISIPVSVAAINNWIQGTNYGFVIATTGTNDGIDFYSIESGNPSTLELTVDDSGCSGGNTAPVADFTYIANDLSVSLTDASSDNDGSIASWSWNFGDGTGSTTQSPNHTYAAAGTYNVTLTVTDNEGATDSTSQAVAVTTSGGGSDLSLATSQDTFVSSSQSNSNFNGSNDELLADGSDSTYGQMMALIKMNLSQIAQCETVTSATLNLNLFNPSGGTYAIYGANVPWSAATATWNSVSGTGVQGALFATFNPSSTGTKSISLNANGIDAINSWVSGTNYGFVVASTGTSDGIDFYSAESGNGSVLDVTVDDSGCTGNNAPVADFSFSASNLDVSFSDSSNDTDGSIVAWSWNFGDGATSSAQSPSHSYASAGTYTVILTVTDNAGATDSVSQSVTVSTPPTGWVELVYDDFESGWGTFLDGGSDAKLSSSYAIGSTSLNLQDNSSSSESRLANSLDLSGYSELKIEFSYVVRSFERSEDFWVRYSANGGSSWQTVKAYVNDVDFVDNGTRYNPVITIDSGSYNFSNNVLIKFECDASGNKDDVYIDNVKISAQ